MQTQNVYKVKPVDAVGKKIEISLDVPGSKSITNRALLIAALADGTTTLSGALFSDDSRYFMECLKTLGFQVEIDEPAKQVKVQGLGGRIPRTKAEIYVGSAGTAARFLTAMLGLSEGTYRINASEQMCRRPMDSLIQSLRELGADVICNEKEGYLPITISNHTKISKDSAKVNIEHSSQFLSALLISGCLCEKDLHIHIDGKHGMSYIDITVKMMEQFGFQVKKINDKEYLIPAGQKYQAKDYVIEPDISAACYFYAMAPSLGAQVMVKNVHLDSMQGDLRFIKLLKDMNCNLSDEKEGILVTGPSEGKYQGVTIDFSSCSDQTMTLAAIAPFATSPTTITGISHIRYQESNRIQAVLNELKKMKIKCEELEDGIKIYPGYPQPSRVETYEDHRMAMAFSLIGLRAQGIVIDNPGCCAKTFENYFEVLDGIIEENILG